MHRTVVAAVQRGDSNEQILNAFVVEHGEAVLMAPPARGFNLAGYLVPGLSIAAIGLALVAWLGRHRDIAPVTVEANAPLAAPDAEQLQRLRRALDDVES